MFCDQIIFSKKNIHFQGSLCCGYGQDGMKTMGYDCVLLPGINNSFTEKIINFKVIFQYS
jgi:hypothetical protein